MSALVYIVPHVKALHVGFIALWMAGLLALFSMLSRQRATTNEEADFRRIRQATHFGYIWAVTPFAGLAVGTGLALMFLRDVYTVWMFGKLILVAGLIATHAFIGHTISAVAEAEVRRAPPNRGILNLTVFVLVAGVLFLVLAKPNLKGAPIPAWLAQPVGGTLPFDVPNP